MLPKPCKQFSKHFTDSTLEANKTTWRSCNYTYETIFSQRDYMLFSVVCCHKRRHFLHIRLAVLRFSFALPVAKGSGARCPKIPSTGRNHIRISILVTCNFQCNAKERQRTQLTWLLEPHQAAAFAVAGQDLHLTKPHGNTNRTENAIGPKTHTDKICCSLPWRACLFHICMFLWLRVSQFLVGCGKLGSKGRCLKNSTIAQCNGSWLAERCQLEKEKI
jgi:hypothetical protein